MARTVPRTARHRRPSAAGGLLLQLLQQRLRPLGRLLREKARGHPEQRQRTLAGHSLPPPHTTHYRQPRTAHHHSPPQLTTTAPPAHHRSPHSSLAQPHLDQVRQKQNQILPTVDIFRIR